MDTHERKQTVAHNGYIPELDGLRAFAVTAVIAYHYSPAPLFRGAFTGVDVFFVISGFVISKSLYATQTESITGYLAGFYSRRILRIAPALLSCLIFFTIASILFIPDSWNSTKIFDTARAAFWGVSNFALVFRSDAYFAPASELNPFLHTWSLSLEEQFYLVFPVIFYLWQKKENQVRKSVYQGRLALPVFALLSLAYCVYATRQNAQAAFYLLPGRFWELAAGALLFQLYVKNTETRPGALIAAAMTWTGAAAVLTSFTLADNHRFPFPWALLPVSGTLLLISGTAFRHDRVTAVHTLLKSKPVAYIGKASYSLYLWHWPVSVMFRYTAGFHTAALKLMALCVTLLLSLLSYHFVETPLRRNNGIRNLKKAIIIPGGLAAIGLVFLTAHILITYREALSLSVTRNNHVWRAWQFAGDAPDPSVTPDPRFKGRKIFAIGDSHTAAYRTMLHIVSTRLGIETIEYEQGGCAIPDLLRPMEEDHKAHYREVLSKVAQQAQPGDIVFLASLRMPELSDRNEALDIEKVLKNYFSDASATLRQAALAEADTVISDFEALGVQVLFEAPLPVLKAPPFLCSDWFNRNNPIAANGLTIDRSLLECIREPVMKSIGELSALHPAMRVWDPFPVLVKGEVFSAYDEKGLPLFYDGDHLSGNGNRHLAPSFMETVVDIWTGK